MKNCTDGSQTPGETQTPVRTNFLLDEIAAVPVSYYLPNHLASSSTEEKHVLGHQPLLYKHAKVLCKVDYEVW